MSKIFRLKNLIICLIVAVLITSVTLFSVSYAKWVNPNTTVTLSAGIGVWNTGITSDPTQIAGGNGIVYIDKNGNQTSVSVSYTDIGNNVGGEDIGWVYYLYFATARQTTIATFAMSRGAGGTGGDAIPNQTTQIQQSSGNGQLTIADSCNEGDTKVVFFDEHTLHITGATVGEGGKDTLTENDYVFELFYFIPKANNPDNQVQYTLTKVQIKDMHLSDDNKNTDIVSLRNRITILD